MKKNEDYKILKKDQKYIKELHNKISTHRIAMDHHADGYRKTMIIFWDTLKEKFPEIDTDKYEYNYDIGTFTITCKGKNHGG